MQTTIGILREGKLPHDKRVPFTPKQCRQLMQQFPNLRIVVQSSPFRCFSDKEYQENQVEVVDKMDDCDILMGVKEVPAHLLIAGKTYFFFSHTIKKQAYNRALLQEILRKKIRLIDYEVLTDKQQMRIIGFGRYAGLVGAYNGIRAWGLRFQQFSLKPAYLCYNLSEMLQTLSSIKVPPIKIVVTGDGRVAGGVLELLNHLKLKQVTVDEFLANKDLSEPEFVQLHPGDYNKHRDGKPFDLLHFFNHPTEYLGNFQQFLPKTDLLIGAAYWDPKAPPLFSLNDTSNKEFRIKVIADITCDIDGSIPTTRHASTIDEPLYDYNPNTRQTDAPFTHPGNITVMAVDNLPCELPRDASEDFGRNLINKVVPALSGTDPDNILERATITQHGKLTPRFSYLQDYVSVAD